MNHPFRRLVIALFVMLATTLSSFIPIKAAGGTLTIGTTTTNLDTDASGSGWTYQSSSCKLTITGNINNEINFQPQSGLGCPMIQVAFSTNASIAGLRLLNSTREMSITGNGKTANKLTTGFISSSGRIIIQNANIEVQEDISAQMAEFYSSTVTIGTVTPKAGISADQDIVIDGSDITVKGSTGGITSNNYIAMQNSPRVSVESSSAHAIVNTATDHVGVTAILINLDSGGYVYAVGTGGAVGAYSGHIVLGTSGHTKILNPTDGYMQEWHGQDGEIICTYGDLANTVVIANDGLQVTSVTVTPAIAAVPAGSSQQFSASLNTTGQLPTNAVTWSVEGAHSGSTKINSSGLLSVGSNETAATLTIKATTIYDPSKSGSGQAVLSASANNFTIGTNTYSLLLDSSGTGWSYSASQCTLSITDSLNQDIGFHPQSSLPCNTIKLSYSNDITINKLTLDTSNKTLELTGTGKTGGKLTLKSINALGSLIINNANLDVSEDINSAQLQITSSSANIGITTPKAGITSSASITFDNADVTIKGSTAGILASGNISFQNTPRITVETASGYGILSTSSNNSSTLTMLINLDNGGYVYSSGPSGAIATYGGMITLGYNGSTKIKIPSDGYIDGYHGDGQGLFGYGYFAKTGLIASDSISVTSVTVSPSSANVVPGFTSQFVASVNGNNTPPNKVTWSVIGATSTNTKIDENGLLTLGSDEASSALSVKATSVFDTSKSGSAAVNVISLSTNYFTIGSEVYSLFANYSGNGWSYSPGSCRLLVTADLNKDVGFYPSDNSACTTITFKYSTNITIGKLVLEGAPLHLYINGTSKKSGFLNVDSIQADGNVTISLTQMKVKEDITVAILDFYTASAEVGLVSPKAGIVTTLGGVKIEDSDLTLKGLSGGINSQQALRVVGDSHVLVESASDYGILIESNNFAGSGIVTLDLNPGGYLVTSGTTTGLAANSGNISLGTYGKIGYPQDGSLGVYDVDGFSIYSNNTIAKKVVITTDGTINSLSLSPSSVALIKGGTKQFTATISSTVNPPQLVLYSIEGAPTSSNTKIDENGLLTIGSDETATSFVVKAMSAFDHSKSATAAVSIVTNDINNFEIGSDAYSLLVDVSGDGWSYTANSCRLVINEDLNKDIAFHPANQSDCATITVKFTDDAIIGKLSLDTSEVRMDIYGNGKTKALLQVESVSSVGRVSFNNANVEVKEDISALTVQFDKATAAVGTLEPKAGLFAHTGYVKISDSDLNVKGLTSGIQALLGVNISYLSHVTVESESDYGIYVTADNRSGIGVLDLEVDEGGYIIATGKVGAVATNSGNIDLGSTAKICYPSDGVLGVLGQSGSSIYSNSTLAPKAVIAHKNSTVDSITIAPVAIDLSAGQSQQFSVSISASDDLPAAVLWTLSGSATSSDTRLDENGLLTLGADETNVSFTVTATSLFDESKSASATVTNSSSPDYGPGSFTVGNTTYSLGEDAGGPGWNYYASTGYFFIGSALNEDVSFSPNPSFGFDVIRIGYTNGTAQSITHTKTIKPLEITGNGKDYEKLTLTGIYTQSPLTIHNANMELTDGIASPEVSIDSSRIVIGEAGLVAYDGDVEIIDTDLSIAGVNNGITAYHKVSISGLSEVNISTASDYGIVTLSEDNSSTAIEISLASTGYVTASGEIAAILSGSGTINLDSNSKIVYPSPGSVESYQDGEAIFGGAALARKATISYSPATIDSVTVSPASVTLSAGQSQQFTASVSGTNNPNTTVVWSLEGSPTSADTTLTQDGVLTLGADEKTAYLSVRATALFDGLKSGVAAVNNSSSPDYGVGSLYIGETAYPLDSNASGVNWNYDASTATLTLSGDVDEDILFWPNPDFSKPELHVVYSSDITVKSIAHAKLIKPLTITGNGKDNATLTLETIDCKAALSFVDANVLSTGGISGSSITSKDSHLDIGEGGLTAVAGNLTIEDSAIIIISSDAGMTAYNQINISGAVTVSVVSGGDYGIRTLSDSNYGSAIIIDVDNTSYVFAYANTAAISTNSGSIDLNSGEILYPQAASIEPKENGEAVVAQGKAAPVAVLGSPVVIDAIEITPNFASLDAGESQQFSATVIGESDPPQLVIWSLAGNPTSDKTKIDQNGNLSIGSNEKATTLYVIAVSAYDQSKSAQATINVHPKADSGYGTLVIDGQTYDLGYDDGASNWHYDAASGTLTINGDIDSDVIFSPTETFPLDQVTVSYGTDVIIKGLQNTSDDKPLLISGNGADQAQLSLENINSAGEIEFADARVNVQHGINGSDVKVNSSNLSVGDKGITATESGITITDSDLTVNGVTNGLSAYQNISVVGSSHVDVTTNSDVAITTLASNQADADAIVIDLSNGGSISAQGSTAAMATRSGKITLSDNDDNSFIEPEDASIESYNGDGEAVYSDESPAAKLVIGYQQTSVSEVNVEPDIANLYTGDAKQFTAVINGVNHPSQEVVWQLLGSPTDSRTQLSENGLLVIGKDETATALEVKATSVFDPSKSGKAIVSISPAPPVDFVIEPTSASLRPGESLAFSVKAINRTLDNEDVTWSLVGSPTSSSTSIDQNGVLHIGSDEKAGSLKVFAFSKKYPEKTAEVTVMIVHGGNTPSNPTAPDSVPPTSAYQRLSFYQSCWLMAGIWLLIKVLYKEEKL
ncbi:MAG: hypothetical protein LBR25_03405 [Erysipelotrichaceae bacterium]|nr:hypothetical protein [Erysipelotrichaceae bacterium]